ncbi:MAG: hypothetical protein AAGC54_11535 [Cyanobacteria bacterium P01_F01_bin.4]
MGTSFRLKCRVTETSATNSINGRDYVTATNTPEEVPNQGYFGFAKYGKANITVENVSIEDTPLSLKRKAALAALGKFNDWVVSGGEQRAGLPPGSMSPLHTSVQMVRSRARQLTHDLENLRKVWSRLAAGEASVLVMVYLKTVVVNLQSVHLQSEALIADSAQSRAILQGAREVVRSHIKDDKTNIPIAERNLEKARRRQAQARRDLRAAKSELQGDKGFLNGFLTGITFTAYNPLQENLDKANTAVATINREVQTIKSQLQILNQSSNELREGKYILDSLNNVNKSLNDYLNFLTKAETSLQEALEDTERAGETQSARLGAYYQKQAGKEMHELFSWIDVFNSVR